MVIHRASDRRAHPDTGALVGTYTRPGHRGADRPQWTACLADLRAGDNLIIWRIDRLGRNLRDLIDIVTTPCRTGLVDTTTAHGALVSACSR
jgi:hypothetical protein